MIAKPETRQRITLFSNFQQKYKYFNTFTATANLELSILYAVNFQSFAIIFIFTVRYRQNGLSVTDS